MSVRQKFSLACLAAGAIMVGERSATAQDALVETTQVVEAASAVTAAPIAVAVAPAEPLTSTEPPRAERSPAKRPSWFVPVHFFTAAVQGMDAHSTLDVLEYRGLEASPLYDGMSGNKVAFLAIKAGIAATVIYATDKLSRKHGIGAALTAAAVNSVFLTMAARNYKSVRTTESRLGLR